jgi:tetratricopeptide (TPR) repeat protein
MPSAGRINTLWSLARESSAEGRRIRRRLGAGAALAMLISGLLAATGLGIVVVAFAAVVFFVAGGDAAVRALAASWPRVRSRGRMIAAALLQRFGIAVAGTRTGLRRVRRLASSALAWLRVRGSGLATGYVDRAFRARRHLATYGEATIARMREDVGRMHRQRLSPESRTIDLHHEARRLNAAGTRSRRDGAYAHAVELHRRALEILHGLDDRRAVALTQNNLALALSHVGDDINAISLFEEAAVTLHELGEEEHEGQIIANLGFAHRRNGRHEQSENVLQLALAKLPPTSRAYETVEAEIRRVS